VTISFPIVEGAVAAPTPVKKLSVDLGQHATLPTATPLTGIEGVQVQVNQANDIKAPKDKEEFKSQFVFKPAAPPKKIDLFVTRDPSQALVLLYAEVRLAYDR
jgi:hypothetical protein